MKSVSLLVTAALMLLLPALPAQAEAPPPAISVSGEATVSAPPDTATIDAGVTSEGKTAKEAIEANNKAMAAVIAALKAAGIAEKDMQTSRLSLYPQNAPSRSGPGNGPVQIVGYRASNRVTVMLHDMAKVGPTIDTMVGAGANEIGGISFSIAQASKLLDAARGQAVADARRKAELYAQAAGVTLGAPLSISEDGGAMPVFARKVGVAMAPAAAPVAIGEETLRVVVSVSWAIRQP